MKCLEGCNISKIYDGIIPDKTETQNALEIASNISNSLMTASKELQEIGEVVIGGSLGKNTHLKQKFDMDITFLLCAQSYSAYEHTVYQQWNHLMSSVKNRVQSGADNVTIDINSLPKMKKRKNPSTTIQVQVGSEKIDLGIGIANLKPYEQLFQVKYLTVFVLHNQHYS